MASCNGTCTLMSNITNGLNDTVLADVLPDGFQHATGQTILWALVALALAAMTQSSQTAGYVGLCDKTSIGETSLHRISPILCLSDAIAEIYLLGRSSLFLFRSDAPYNINEIQTSNQFDEDDSTNVTAEESSNSTRQTSTTIENSAAPHPVNSSQSLGQVPNETTPRVNNDVKRTSEEGEHSTADEITGNRDQAVEAQTEETVVSYESQQKDIVIGRFISAVNAATEAIPDTDGPGSSSPRNGTTNASSSGSSRDLSSNVISKCFNIVKDSRKTPLKPVKKMSSTLYCMKMSLFVLGALPQSIKLFAIQGIPFTQAIAATYLIAITAHGLRLFVDSIVGSRLDKQAKLWSIEKTTWNLLELSHWLVAILLWSSIVNHIQPPDIVGETLRNYTPLPIAVFVALTVLVGCFVAFRTPCIPVQRRWLINHYYWAYAISSTLVWIVINSQHERALGTGAFARLDWRFGKAVDYLMLQIMFIIPLLALPILPCILVAQMMRWSFVTLSRLQTGDETRSEETQELISMDEKTKRAREVVDTFRELLIVVARDQSKKIETAAEFSHRRKTRSWAAYMREVCGQLAKVMSCVLNPTEFLDKAKDWLSNLHYEVKWTAFLLFNILTATMYYTLCFDSTATTQPAWTVVLG